MSIPHFLRQDGLRRGSGRTWPTAALASAALLLLLLCTRATYAAPADPLPCDPSNTAANRCLTADPYIVEHLELRAAGDSLAFAMTNSPGDAQLRVLDATTLSTRGVLPFHDAPLLYQSGYLYTTSALPITTTGEIQRVVGVQAADRPALLSGYSLPFTDAVDWAISADALYVLAASPAGSGYDLRALSLHDPAQPRLVAYLPALERTRLLVQGNRLYAAGATGLTIFDISDPLSLQPASSVELFRDAPLADVDVAASGGFVYVMGRTVLTGAPVCRIIDARAAAEQIESGGCPFLPHKTTIVGDFAYVNPNLSPAEYLDYGIYSLANPAAPTIVGDTPQRWRTAVPIERALIVQTFDGRIARLRQANDGSLSTAASTWSADELEVDGPVRAVVGNLALVDRNTSGPNGERVLRLVDVTQRTAPLLRGALVSPWIGTQNLAVEGTRLYALHRNRLTIFDVRNPAAPVQIGQYISPLNESLDHMVVGPGGMAYLLSEHNTLLDVDCSTPTTPTLAAMADFSESTQVAALANRTLYLFGAQQMLVVDVSQPRQPQLLRHVPVAAPTAATAWAEIVYLVDNGALQVLDVSRAANPVPGVHVEPPAGMRFAPLGGARAGRLALLVQRAPGSGGGAMAPYVAIYDLSLPLSPRLVATVPGDFDDAYFDGGRLLLPGPRVVAIGPRTRLTAPLLESQLQPIAMAPGDDLPPGVAMTYTLSPSEPSAEAAHAAVAPNRCLQHESDPERPWLPPPGTSTYAGPFTVRIVDCTTGAPVALDRPLTVTVALPPAATPPYDWPAAALYTDEGRTWEAIAGAQRQGNLWTATLAPPLMWGVRGPAPAPVLLPWVAR